MKTTLAILLLAASVLLGLTKAYEPLPHELAINTDDLTGSRYALSVYTNETYCTPKIIKGEELWKFRTHQLWVKTDANNGDEPTRGKGLQGQILFYPNSGEMRVYEGGVYYLHAQVFCRGREDYGSPCGITIRVNDKIVAKATAYPWGKYDGEATAAAIEFLRPGYTVSLYNEGGCVLKDTNLQAMLYMPDGTRKEEHQD